MALDLASLWDFNQPEVSEQRFRAALVGASVDETIILQTQIARTYGLRRDFSHAQQILADLEPQITGASAEAQTRYFLELGRTFSSATHPPESQTAYVKERARTAYMSAARLAQEANLDHLAIDALHMMAFIDTAPEQQLAWNHKALQLIETSSQPQAKKWEGSLRNNTGYALHELGRYEEALVEFELALAYFERHGNAQQIRIAHWMVAWTLRSLGRLDEALAIQLCLEKECDEAGEPDTFVFEELELLYRGLNDPEKAALYARRRKAAG